MGYKELTEGSRMDILQREYYKEFIGEGQVFYMSKRLGVERMLMGEIRNVQRPSMFYQFLEESLKLYKL